MSDEFKDRDDIDTENTYTDNDTNEAVPEQNFVMKEPDKAQEPGETPTPENSCYAYSYRKSTDKETQEERKEQKAETSEAAEERQQYGEYHFTAPATPQEHQRKCKRPKNRVKKVGIFLASAAAFGLVAGVVFQGVNYAADQLLPNNDVKIENTPISNGTTNVSAGNEEHGSVSEVARNVMPSIVSITSLSVQEVPNYFGFGTQQYPSESSGSGIIVGQNDTELLIATNNHVVQNSDSLTVCFTNQDGTAASSSNLENTSAQTQDPTEGNNSSIDTGSAVAGQVKGTDADNDLAVVSVKLADIPEDVRSEIKVATIGDSDSLIIGEQVVAIGNALGYGQSVTSGYVSALNKQVSSENADSTFIQTDAAINPGNSGGALLNMKGELVGINSAKIASDEVEGMGFAIPISKAEPILDQLMSRETREKVEDENKAAYLGVICSDVISESAERYHIPVGVFVEDVEENGPADKAGIKRGDIIVKIDGTSVKTATNLTEQLQYYEAGEEVEFVISRADDGEYKEQTIKAKLGAKKDSTTQNQMQQQGR